MPKKHQKAAFSKPASTAHHSLSSDRPRTTQNDRSRPSHASSSTAEHPSVTDLINHLRRTQTSRSPVEDASRRQSTAIAPRSVHPSLRNLLELPETPPPRPRPGTARRVGVGGQRLRRIAGPPPPESWLAGNYSLDGAAEEPEAINTGAADTDRVIYRLDRLPGIAFPGSSALLHMVLKSMALHWIWHVEYDGRFLGLLPSHLRVLLLSYIAVYARDQPLGGVMQGLRPLFEKTGPRGGSDDLDGSSEDVDAEVTRLDLGGALGQWMTFKQISNELLVSKKRNSVQPSMKDPVPSSWEDDDEDGEDTNTTPSNVSSPIPKSLKQGLRFENLRFLSLAHPSPAAANWNSLIDLLSRLSTITHLSLAHWPVPTVTPNAINTRVRHPNHRSLTFSYGGTDSYTAMENSWTEAAGILRRLSRATYCLQWLDLEGCGDWISALNFDAVGPDGEACATGPEWNASWRNVEFVRLGPGWLPHVDDSELPAPADIQQTSRSLETSIHAPSGDSEPAEQSWDVEVERVKYRRAKELERFREIVGAAKAAQRRILRIRKDEGRGKWVHFSFGLEGLEEDVLRRLLGKEYLRLLP